MRLIRLLWDSTEAYRALYYNSAAERGATTEAHERIIAVVRGGDLRRVVFELDDHRARALKTLSAILAK
jgi:DNA-binding GntR family transcriptional regulator